ncbi:hypothetical protein [Amycolatopsis sp. NPDC001319]|uniref:hypothetical protein n=1 Tax=unclassified Amycolatopsis TaxID=2618356 RepID=UPI0036CE715F
MALSDKQKDVLLVVLGALAVIVSILAIAFGALYAVSNTAPNPDPTMTVCRPQYGNCTEATR